MTLLKKGIRRRWMVNSIGSVFLLLLVAMISFSVFVGNYYYNSIRSALQTQASSVSDFFSSYATSERTYLEMANYYINDFDERESLELQFISTSGQIVLSSYGLTSGGSPGTDDIAQAIKTRNVSSWSGRDPSTGERIMAVSAPILYGDEVKGVIRLVSSLSIVDRQFIFLILIALGVCLVALTMVYFTNLYFIRSIVEPMTNITETAKRIAAGGYGIQIEREFDDEIGELATTINDMSQKIGQNEKMQREFISSVSHELRTPLTAINGVRPSCPARSGTRRASTRACPSSSARDTGCPRWWRSCWSSPGLRTAASPLTWSRWTSPRSLRTPYSPTGSCTGKRTSSWSTPLLRRNSPSSPGIRNGCVRCSPTCWTTRLSTAAAIR